MDAGVLFVVAELVRRSASYNERPHRARHESATALGEAAHRSTRAGWPNHGGTIVARRGAKGVLA
jgi:hypothetical protein